MNKRDIRRLARASAASLLRVNVSTQDGDLWIDAEDLTEVERDVFAAEVLLIAERIEPT